MSPRALPLRPTRTGLYWLVLVLALLATAINYGNNTVFAMAFVLLALWLQAAWQCHRHLRGLRWLPQSPAPVFAGETLHVRADVEGAQAGALLWMTVPGRTPGLPACASPQGDAQCQLGLPTSARGEHTVDHLHLVCRWPLGLWQAQRPLPGICALVYPRPAGSAALPGQAHAQAHQHSASSDFQDLRPFAPGDAPQRIQWRVFARRDELLVGRFDGERGGQAVWLDFADCAGDAEQRLSQLVQWILATEQAAQHYGLRLPGLRIAPAHGKAHRHQCLRQLALLEARA